MIFLNSTFYELNWEIYTKVPLTKLSLGLRASLSLLRSWASFHGNPPRQLLGNSSVGNKQTAKLLQAVTEPPLRRWDNCVQEMWRQQWLIVLLYWWRRECKFLLRNQTHDNNLSVKDSVTLACLLWPITEAWYRVKSLFIYTALCKQPQLLLRLKTQYSITNMANRNIVKDKHQAQKMS